MTIAIPTIGSTKGAERILAGIEAFCHHGHSAFAAMVTGTTKMPVTILNKSFQFIFIPIIIARWMYYCQFLVVEKHPDLALGTMGRKSTGLDEAQPRVRGVVYEVHVQARCAYRAQHGRLAFQGLVPSRSKRYRAYSRLPSSV